MQRSSRFCAAPSGLKAPLQHGRKMMDERLLNPISTRELERRWAAVRKIMAERKIDALVMQNNNDWLGGYVRRLTDTPLSNRYPRSVGFPPPDLITVVDMGPPRRPPQTPRAPPTPPPAPAMTPPPPPP